jgi:hypothetical protein
MHNAQKTSDWTNSSRAITPTYQNAEDALLCPWFKCIALSKSSEVCNGLRGLKWVQTCIAWDCEVWCIVLGLKLMKMCNKKQYIYFICPFMGMFYRSLEVRDKNKESSIYAQNSWIVDTCLILLYLTKCGYCSKKSLKIPKG